MCKALDERARQIVAGLEAELQQLRKQGADIRAAIDAQKAASRDSRKGADLEALRKETESSKNLYEVLLRPTATSRRRPTGTCARLSCSHGATTRARWCW